ncbi:MAG: YHS domain-containing protein [Candidatus Tectomicrobia bacterium]|nr:YHS domain-containing protein [Candidatus Tectomicrobia bacterium]
MAKDPVCGAEVEEKSASKAEYQGKTYYFCCDHCKMDFEKEPAKYAK